MSQRIAVRLSGLAVAGLVSMTIVAGQTSQEPTTLQRLSRRPTSTMTNPYRLIENWPTLRPGMEWGAAIGLIPDDTGGTWMMFRSEPPINYITADGESGRSEATYDVITPHKQQFMGRCSNGHY